MYSRAAQGVSIKLGSHCEIRSEAEVAGTPCSKCVCTHILCKKKVKEGAAVRPSFTWLQAGTEGQRTLSNLERIILELWYKSICGKEHPPPPEHPLETRHI